MPRPALFGTIVLSAAFAAVPAHSQTPSFIDLFEAMARDPIADPPLVAWRVLAAIQPEDAADLFEREGERWVRAAPESRGRRRAIVAAVAAAAANRLGPRSWRAAVAVLERGCDAIREGDPPAEAERRFHHVANALLQAGGDGIAAELHSAHALRRFPDDPRLVLARAVAAELRSWPDNPAQTPADRDRELARQLLERLRTATKHDDVRAEAFLRMGMLALRNRYYDQAVTHLQQVPSLTGEPYLAYLASLLEGRAHERDGRLDEAVRAYERALETVPGAQSATLALSAVLVALGKPDESERRVRAIVTAPGAVDDPWFRYGSGDARQWPALVAALREALR